MKLKKVSSLSLVCLSLLSAVSANGAPMDPKDRKAPGQYSAYTLDSFTLFADSTDSSLVYFVPRNGAVRVKSPLSSEPRPVFSAAAYTPSFGFFAGEELVSLGGTVSSTGDLGALKVLEQEAVAQGLTLAPLPVESASVLFQSRGMVLENGRVDVQCEKESLKITKSNGEERTVSIPKCFTRLNPNDPYKLDTNIMYSFASTSLGDAGTTARDISFSAVLLPGYKDYIEGKLISGSSWNEVLQPTINWKAKTERKSYKAELIVNWQKLFERAEVFAAYHNWACVDVEMQGFWEKQLDCKNAEDCAIRPQFYDERGQKTDVVPTNSDFLDFVKSVQEKLQNEVWNPIEPALGRVSTKTSSQFTLRANYQKIEKERNETITLLWNPGATAQSTETSFDVSCLRADSLGDKIKWDIEDPSCKAQLGQ